jgi:hypothetical protein
VDRERRGLGQACLRLLFEDFAQHASPLLRDAREQRPYDYLRLVASLLPKEMNDPEANQPQVRQIRRIVVRPGDPVS